jgi:hypothetical protein
VSIARRRTHVRDEVLFRVTIQRIVFASNESRLATSYKMKREIGDYGISLRREENGDRNIYLRDTRTRIAGHVARGKPWRTPFTRAAFTARSSHRVTIRAARNERGTESDLSRNGTYLRRTSHRMTRPSRPRRRRRRNFRPCSRTLLRTHRCRPRIH